MTTNKSRQRLVMWISFTTAVLAIVLSTYILYLTIWQHGVRLTTDSISYMKAGYSFYQGHGLCVPIYQSETDTITCLPLTHYPPLPSIIYSIVLYFGISWHNVPAVISLISWTSFLLGIGWLTYRLGGSPLLAALAIIIATITPHLVLIFQYAMSEVIFLPLLVWLMIILVDLPARQSRWMLRLALATLFLALIMLTRYVGVFVFASVLIWWVWGHIRQPPKLIRGGVILSFAVLPLAAWIVRNTVQEAPPLGRHLSTSEYTMIDGLLAIITEGTSILLPSVTFDSFQRNFGQGTAFFFYVALLISSVGLFWRYQPRRDWLKPLHRTPILVFLSFYVLLYTVVQPFFSFYPMDMRDMTTILCLTIPSMFALMAQIPVRWWSSFLLSGYIVLNSAFAFGPIVYQGLPNWLSIFPPHIKDITTEGRSDQDRASGFISWLAVEGVRNKSLLNNHQEMLTWVQSLDSEVVVLTNEHKSLLFVSHPFAITLLSWRGLTSAEIPCTSQYTLVLVLFDWYRFEATSLQNELEQKCPNISRSDFDHSTVYLLRP